MRIKKLLWVTSRPLSQRNYSVATLSEKNLRYIASRLEVGLVTQNHRGLGPGSYPVGTSIGF